MKVHKGNKDGSYNEPPELPELNLFETPRHRSNKNTKRWCLGKVGREHIPQWVPKFYSFGDKQDIPAYFEHSCVKCKKILKVKYNKKYKL